MDASAQVLLLQVQRQYAASLIDAATKLAFHSKRGQLALADLPPLPGHGGAPAPHLMPVPEAADILFRPEQVLSTAEAEPLPKPPLEVGVTPHWLAVAGVQPATAENAQPRATGPRPAAGSRPPLAAGAAAAAAARQAAAAPAAAATTAQHGGGEAGGGGGIVAGLPLRHSLPDELQVYFDTARRVLQGKQGGPMAGQAVAASLATDPGLQPVLPYLVPLLAQEVGSNLADAAQLHVLLSAIRGLLSNAHLDLVPYMHHLLPAILTCLVARHIGTAQDHWAVRDEAAGLLGQVAQRSQQRDDELAAALARVQQSLAAALLDEVLETQYGSLVGLAAFGPPVLLHTVVPRLGQLSNALQDAQATPAAMHVRAALLAAVGQCVSWSGGAQAAAIVKQLGGSALEEVMLAAVPATPAYL